MIERLTGTIQPYAWGSHTFLADLLGTEPCRSAGRAVAGCAPLAAVDGGGRVPGRPGRGGPRGDRRFRFGGRVRAQVALSAQGPGRRPAALAAGAPVAGSGRGRLRAGAGVRPGARLGVADLQGRLAETGDALRADRDSGTVRVPSAGADPRAVRRARRPSGRWRWWHRSPTASSSRAGGCPRCSPPCCSCRRTSTPSSARCWTRPPRQRARDDELGRWAAIGHRPGAAVPRRPECAGCPAC